MKDHTSPKRPQETTLAQGDFREQGTTLAQVTLGNHGKPRQPKVTSGNVASHQPLAVSQLCGEMETSLFSKPLFFEVSVSVG